MKHFIHILLLIQLISLGHINAAHLLCGCDHQQMMQAEEMSASCCTSDEPTQKSAETNPKSCCGDGEHSAQNAIQKSASEVTLCQTTCEVLEVSTSQIITVVHKNEITQQFLITVASFLSMPVFTALNSPNQKSLSTPLTSIPKFIKNCAFLI